MEVVETNHSQFKCNFVINTNQIKIKLHCFTCQKRLRLNLIYVSFRTYTHILYLHHVMCATHLSIWSIKNKNIYRQSERKNNNNNIVSKLYNLWGDTHGHIDIYAKLTQNFVIRGVYKPSKSVRHFRIIDSFLTRFIQRNTS